MSAIDNPNPEVYSAKIDLLSEEELAKRQRQEHDNEVADDIDELEVFDMIRNIEDPEHPLSLEQLRVVSLEQVKVNNQKREVEVSFTPTIPHCSSASIIGLMIRTKLGRGLPENYKIAVSITKGTHNSDTEISKQLADKERVSAALENKNISKQINKRIKDTDDVTAYLV